MPDQCGTFEMSGDLSPRELADRLGWPRHIVLELIEQQRIVRTAVGWRIDVAAELRRRWARSVWDAADGAPDQSKSPDVPDHRRTEDES
jgi:hypothetical protein